jgi:hypothetical protein
MIFTGMQFPALMDQGAPGPGFFSGMAVFILCMVMAYLMMVSFVCAMALKYQEAPDRPLIEGIWPYVKRTLGPAFGVFVTILLLVVTPYLLIIVLAFWSGVGSVISSIVPILIFLSFPLLIYLIVPLTIFMIAHVIERNALSVSLKRGFFLVREKWWNTFGVFLVISMLAGIASYLFMIPAYILFFIQTLGSMDSGELSTEFGMWLGILYACGFLGSLFTGMYQMLGMLLQYYNLRERKEGTGLLRRIQEIDNPPASRGVEFQ